MDADSLPPPLITYLDSRGLVLCEADNPDGWILSDVTIESQDLDPAKRASR